MQIKLTQFEGPLDLLLTLIEEQKLNITEISLAQVTEQFLQYMRKLTDIRPNELSDWLVVASKLLVIKSRALMPSLRLSEEDEEDATDLAWRLYQFKLYKEAARMLDRTQKRNRQSWGRSTAFAQRVTFYPDPNAGRAALAAVMRHLASSLAAIATIPKKVLEEVVSISEKISDLQKLIAVKTEMKMRELLKSASSKTEIIVTFLALLELVKQKILTVEQEAIFSDITIRKSR